MKKFFVVLGLFLLALVAAGALFREQVLEVAKSAITKDMFVTADTDDFNPGLPVGATFPAISALHEGRQIYDVGEFLRDKGMIFVANRSADW